MQMHWAEMVSAWASGIKMDTIKKTYKSMVFIENVLVDVAKCRDVNNIVRKKAQGTILTANADFSLMKKFASDIESDREVRMKRIGIRGGMSWDSTAHYYTDINREIRRRLGGLCSADIVLHSVEFSHMHDLQARGKWHEAGRVLNQCTYITKCRC
ncbi:MAG: hypothetical protein R3A45_03655 [Bdellovibrionota bacterium]